MKTQNSIKQIVGKAIGRYNRGEHNDCTGYVVFNDAKTFTVRTTVAHGDNVPWARKPMDAYIFNALNRAGIKADFASQEHSCGNVSMNFFLPVA
ncbi:MAG: hypothetical protein KGJ13_09605 [Patescibacteria group bacterium]|nr:hypothetical protein [Patescibacteria group bacterium]